MATPNLHQGNLIGQDLENMKNDLVLTGISSEDKALMIRDTKLILWDYRTQ